MMGAKGPTYMHEFDYVEQKLKKDEILTYENELTRYAWVVYQKKTLYIIGGIDTKNDKMV